MKEAHGPVASNVRARTWPLLSFFDGLIQETTENLNMASDRLQRSPEWRILGALYAAEVCLVLGLLAWHRQIGKSNPAEFWTSFYGIVTIVAFIGMATMLVVALWWCLADRQAGSRRWVLALWMNVVVVAVVLFVGEVALRMLVVPTNTGEKLGSLLLHPRQWMKAKAAYLSILDKADQSETYMVADEDFGWTLGKGRRSHDGLYSIGNQGFRTARAGEVIANETLPCRIAIVGDSYTFGSKVAFEDTWGSVLESELGGHCQVLNFGVAGFGVDQMYLRYLRDIRPWHPNMVILAFIGDDVKRTMGVYSFLMFPNADYPFPKPRFVIHNGESHIINRPLLSSRQIFSIGTIGELPFINYDIMYAQPEWDQPGWNYFYRSYIFRLLTSLRPLYKHDRPETSISETMRINGALFLKFRQAVIDDGAMPLIVYLPEQWDIMEEAREAIGVKILKSVQVAHVNVTPCMRSFSVSDLFNAPEVGGHYSVKGNREAAKCMIEDVKSSIQEFAPR